jgi:transposase
MYDGMKYFPRSIGTMVRWFGEVVGYFDGRTTTGRSEEHTSELQSQWIN